MTTWTLLTSHCRVLLSISKDHEARLRDIADELGITERRAYAIVNDLTQAGYVIKYKDGRRNRYEIQEDLAIPDDLESTQSIGGILRSLRQAR
jgi:DNA-binding IclR family transcriptional regulator